MKSKIYFLAVFLVLLFNLPSYSQNLKLIQYISFEIGTGNTEVSIANRDSIANNFGITTKSALFGGVSVKIPYLVGGLYYYDNKFTMTDRGQTYEINNGYLSLVALYDFLQLNMSDLIFASLKLGLSGSVLISKKDNGPRFQHKSMVVGINGKIDATVNVAPTIGITVGLDYNYNGLSNPIIVDDKYPLRLSSFKFFAGLRKYF
jgi:hypothetical protein